MNYKEWQSKFDFDLKQIFPSKETKQVILAYCLGIVSLAQKQVRDECATLALKYPEKSGMELAQLIRNNHLN
jgi:hypothetical protein